MADAQTKAVRTAGHADGLCPDIWRPLLPLAMDCGPQSTAEDKTPDSPHVQCNVGCLGPKDHQSKAHIHNQKEPH